MDRKLIIGLVVVVFLVAAGYALMQRIKPAETPPPLAVEVTVITEAPKVGPFADTIAASGDIAPVDVTDVDTKAMGVVAWIGAREGDTVRQGQLVARLRDDDLRAQVAQAEASVHSAEAMLAQAKAGSTITNTTSETMVAQAQAALASSQTRLTQAQSAYQLQQANTTATVAQAEQALAAGRERLAALKSGARTQEREQARQAVEAASSSLETARKNLERMQKLLDGGAIAPAQYDLAKNQYELASSQYQQAKAAQSLVQEGARAEDIKAVEADVKRLEAVVAQARASGTLDVISLKDIDNAREAVRQAEAGLAAARAGLGQKSVNLEQIRGAEAGVRIARAGLQQARVALSMASVYAPFSGVVVAKLTERGQMHSPGMPIIRLVRAGSIFASLQVPESQAGRIKLGLPASIKVDSLPGREFTGVVTEIIPMAAEGNRAVIAKVKLANPDNKLYVGAYAQGRIVVSTLEGALTVPLAAIKGETGKEFVYVASGGTAKKREVKLGIVQGDVAQIMTGLAPTDEVIIEGQVEDGSSVKLAQQAGGAQ